MFLWKKRTHGNFVNNENFSIDKNFIYFWRFFFWFVTLDNFIHQIAWEPTTAQISFSISNSPAGNIITFMIIILVHVVETSH